MWSGSAEQPTAGLGLVMDYAAGGSLAQLVNCRGPLGVGETVTVLTPIAQALGYLHGKGFMHSDVAPGNVLFTAHGKPLLADLGITRMVGDAAVPFPAGTDGFLDPAPVDALRAGLQPERDVYSAAAVGWYCLTGKAPEPRPKPSAAVPLVPDVPAALAAALEAGLKEDRRERPTALEFAAAIYRSADAAPVDLAGAVHPTVLPQLLTRRNLPPSRSRPPCSEAPRLAAPPGRCGRSRQTEGPRPGPACRGKTAVGPRCGGSTCVHGDRVRVVPGRVTAGSRPGIGARAAGAGTGCHCRGPPATRFKRMARQLALSQKPEEAAGDWHSSGRLRSAQGKLELLDEVNLENSPAAAADARISGRLRDAGHVLAGFDTTLTRAETEPDGSDSRAVVAITAVTSAYQETDAGGKAVAAEAAGSEQRLRLVLISSGGRWRIQEILPAS